MVKEGRYYTYIGDNKKDENAFINTLYNQNRKYVRYGETRYSYDISIYNTNYNNYYSHFYEGSFRLERNCIYYSPKDNFLYLGEDRTILYEVKETEVDLLIDITEKIDLEGIEKIINTKRKKYLYITILPITIFGDDIRYKCYINFYISMSIYQKIRLNCKEYVGEALSPQDSVRNLLNRLKFLSMKKHLSDLHGLRKKSGYKDE